MNHRGIYFFGLDAIIASIIILLAVYFILSMRAQSPESVQSYAQAEDFMDFIMQTQVRDFNGNYTQGLVEDSNITNTHHTLFEQIAEFHLHNKTDINFRFVEEIVNGSLLSHNGVLYAYNDENIYNRSYDIRKNAGVVLSSKKISFLRINTSTVYGPHVVEVQAWY